MANILNVERRALNGKNRVLKTYDTCVHVDEDGKMLLGVVVLTKDATDPENTVTRPNDGQLTDTEGMPIFKTVPIQFFPESETRSFAPADIFRITDRLYYPGDFVKRDGIGRLGFILKVRQTASARIIEARSKHNSENALYVYNKPREQFWSPMQKEFKIGALFHMRGWIGEVTSYNRDVVLKVFRSQEEFSTRNTVIGTGRNCRVCRSDLLDLRDFKNDSLNKDSRFEVYPGLILKLAWGPFSRINPHWESKPMTPPRSAFDIVYAEVLNIEVTSVRMNWLKQIPGTFSSKPKINFKKREFTALDCIQEKGDSVVGLGDLMMCRMDQNTWEQVYTKAMWQNMLAKKFHLHRRVCKRPYPRDNEISQPKTPKELSESVPVEIMETNTEVEVEWLDGVIESTPALDVNPIRYAKCTSSPVADVVCLYTERTNTKKYGVVQSVRLLNPQPSANETFMIIQWYRIPDNLADPPLPDGPVQEHSYMDLDSTYMKFRTGEVVMTSIERNNDDFSYGEVIATLTDGLVRVRGPNGTIFRIWPHHLTRIKSPEFH